MYAVFTWIYGIDLTDIAHEVHKPRGKHYKYSEEELAVDGELMFSEDGDFMTTEYAGSGKYPYYVGVELGSWDEMDPPAPQPTIESSITLDNINELNEKLEKFKEKCPTLFAKTGGAPKIFLSRSTS